MAKRGRKPGPKSRRTAGVVAAETSLNATLTTNTRKTKIVTTGSRTGYASVADEYDYTLTHGSVNDNSIEGISLTLILQKTVSHLMVIFLTFK